MRSPSIPSLFRKSSFNPPHWPDALISIGRHHHSAFPKPQWCNYSDIYVTTAGGYDRSTEGSGAGAIFHLQAGVKGIPEFTSRISVI